MKGSANKIHHNICCRTETYRCIDKEFIDIKRQTIKVKSVAKLYLLDAISALIIPVIPKLHLMLNGRKQSMNSSKTKAHVHQPSFQTYLWRTNVILGILIRRVEFNNQKCHLLQPNGSHLFLWYNLKLLLLLLGYRSTSHLIL